MILDIALSLEEILFKIIIPLILATLFAYLIGFERQKIGKAAGISSHILVAFASTAIAILQRLMFEMEIELVASGILVSAQSQRVIAQVLTGIGFIGAGVILKENGTIKGITTATTIWSSAILGLIFGSGYIILGLITGFFIVIFVFSRDFVRGFNPFKEDDKNTEDHL
jgi:putative Mg2+ transporter-C (MgtC) family protein